MFLPISVRPPFQSYSQQLRAFTEIEHIAFPEIAPILISSEFSRKMIHGSDEQLSSSI